jgi:hypothetical protein
MNAMNNFQFIALMWFSMLAGMAVTFRWMSAPRTPAEKAAMLRGMALTTLAVILWLALLPLIPDPWQRAGPILGLLGLALLCGRNSAAMSSDDKASIRRIQIGIAIGAAILAAFCLLLFWPR